jgi:hypothetical protein
MAGRRGVAHLRKPEASIEQLQSVEAPGEHPGDHYWKQFYRRFTPRRPFGTILRWDNFRASDYEPCKMTVAKPVRYVLQVATLGFIAAAIAGCAAGSTQYQSWGKQINAAPKRHQSKEDISRILDHEPVKCVKIPGKPTIGMLFRHDSGTTVLDIFPDSPVIGTGIRVGDKIISINSKPVHSMEDIIFSTEGMKGPDTPVTIETRRGTYVVTPQYPTEAEQCYWEISEDQPGRDEAGALRGDKPPRRFFSAVCRFADGKAYICRPHWQE